MFFWKKKQPEGKKKFVWMSKGVVTGKKAKDDAKKEAAKESAKNKPKVAGSGVIAAPVQPYLGVILDDIKSLLNIDDKSKKKKQVYNDFMEHYFKKD